MAEKTLGKEKMILPRWLRIFLVLCVGIVSIIIIIAWLSLIFDFGKWTSPTGETPSKLKILISLGIFTMILIPIWIFIKNHWKEIFSE